MKITNVDKGKAYHLSSDTMLQVERPNLFFNEYGEQTNPVSLPNTDANREILDYPVLWPESRNRLLLLLPLLKMTDILWPVDRLYCPLKEKKV